MLHARVLTGLRCSTVLSKTGKSQHHLLQQLWLPYSMLPTHHGNSQDSSSSRLQECAHAVLMQPASDSQ